MIRLVKKRKYIPNVAKENFSKGQKVKVLFTMPEGGGDLEDLEAKYGTLEFIGEIIDIIDDGKYEVSISETLDGKKVEKEFQDFWIAKRDDLKALERRSFKRHCKVAKENYEKGQMILVEFEDVEDFAYDNEQDVTDLVNFYGTSSFYAKVNSVKGDDVNVDLIKTKDGEAVDKFWGEDWQIPSVLTIATERRSFKRRGKVAKESYNIGDKVLVNLDASSSSVQYLENIYNTLSYVGTIVGKLPDGTNVVTILETLDGKPVDAKHQSQWSVASSRLKSLEHRNFKRGIKVAKESFEVGDKVTITITDDFGKQGEIFKMKYQTDKFKAIVTDVTKKGYYIKLTESEFGAEITDKSMSENWYVTEDEISAVERKSSRVSKENYEAGQKFKLVLGDEYEYVHPEWEGETVNGEITNVSDKDISIRFTLPDGDTEHSIIDLDYISTMVQDGVISFEKSIRTKKARVAKESFEVGDKVEITLKDELGNDSSISELKREYGTTTFIAEVAELDGDDYRINLLTTKSGKPIDDEDLAYDWIAKDSELKPVTERRTKRLKRVNVAKENRKFRKRKISVESKRVKTMLNFSKTDK